MKLSSKSRYGLKVMCALGRASERGEEFVSVAELSSRASVPYSFLEKIVSALKKHKLIESVRGASGGYKLSKPSENISVGEILRSTEKELLETKCTGGNCSEKNCPNRDVFAGLYAEINSFLNKISLKDMLDKEK